MDLYNRGCDPPPKARELAEAAEWDSVTPERLGCCEVPGLLGTRLSGSRYLHERPLVAYLPGDERPRHLFARGRVGRDEADDLVASGGYSVMVAVTDLRVLFVVGHRDDPDQTLSVPYDTVAGAKAAPSNVWLRTDDEKYRIRSADPDEIEAARDYVLELADVRAEGYLQEGLEHDLSATMAGDDPSNLVPAEKRVAVSGPDDGWL
jgi:hypothetical protein